MAVLRRNLPSLPERGASEPETCRALDMADGLTLASIPYQRPAWYPQKLFYMAGSGYVRLCGAAVDSETGSLLQIAAAAEAAAAATAATLNPEVHNARPRSQSL